MGERGLAEATPASSGAPPRPAPPLRAGAPVAPRLARHAGTEGQRSRAHLGPWLVSARARRCVSVQGMDVPVPNTVGNRPHRSHRAEGQEHPSDDARTLHQESRLGRGLVCENLDRGTDVTSNGASDGLQVLTRRAHNLQSTGGRLLDGLDRLHEPASRNRKETDPSGLGCEARCRRRVDRAVDRQRSCPDRDGPRLVGKGLLGPQARAHRNLIPSRS